MATTSTNGELQKDMDSIREDLAALRTDLSSLVGTITDSGKNGAANLKRKAQDAGTRAVAATESQIQDRPFLSILVVFLIGLVLGKVFDARVRG